MSQKKHKLAIAILTENLNKLEETLEDYRKVNLTHYEIVREAFETEINSLKESINKLQVSSPNQFVGMVIKDFFCNGFFGSREYGLEGAEIIHSTETSITVRKRDGKVATADFDDGWGSYMESYIYEWCQEKGDDE